MKKLMYTVALVVMGITASYAQKQERVKLTAEERAEKTASAMQQKLTLSADQKQKTQQIELDRIKKSDEWREKDHSAMKGKMEERKAFMKSNREKVEAVLTADQKKTLAASRDEMRQKMKDRKGDGKSFRGSKRGQTPPAPPAKN